jgi:hypothetical protein
MLVGGLRAGNSFDEWYEQRVSGNAGMRGARFNRRQETRQAACEGRWRMEGGSMTDGLIDGGYALR